MLSYPSLNPCTAVILTFCTKTTFHLLHHLSAVVKSPCLSFGSLGHVGHEIGLTIDHSLNYKRGSGASYGGVKMLWLQSFCRMWKENPSSAQSLLKKQLLLNRRSHLGGLPDFHSPSRPCDQPPSKQYIIDCSAIIWSQMAHEKLPETGLACCGTRDHPKQRQAVSLESPILD